jgi:hypothetical protein
MARRRFAGKTSRYNRKKMPGPPNPLDAAFRAFLKSFEPNEPQIAKQVGRSQSWLHKYLRGKGKATIDDVVQLVAVIVHAGASAASVTASQRELLKMWHELTPENRNAVKKFVEHLNARQRERRTKPGGPSPQNNRGTSGKSPGTRPRE